MIKSSNSQKIIKRIPKEFLLTETDGPFIKVNKRVVESEDISLVINYLNSEFRTEQMENQIFANYMNLIRKIK